MAAGALVLLVVGAAAAQNPAPGGSADAPAPVLRLSLRAALDAAVDRNPEVQLYRERIEAARRQAQTQLGALLPNLGANVRQSRQTQFLGTIGLAPVRTDPFSIFDARASATQNLFSLSLIQKWRSSRLSLHVAEHEADVRKFDTMASVALLYMEGLKANALAQAHEANREVMAELLHLVRQRRRAGLATGLDVARLEAQIANERQRASAARYDVRHSHLSLANLLVLPFDTPLALTDEFRTDDPLVPSASESVEQALSNRPEVNAQFRRVQAMELLYASIAGERIPSLVAQGDYGRVGHRWNETLETYTVALLLQVPIFDGGQREGRIAETRSQLRQEALRMQSVVNQVKLEVHDALAAMASAQEQAETARAGLTLATRELDLARERYAIITAASYFELTNGLTSLARARENLVQALFQANAARVNLARSTGTLNLLQSGH
jgi:outer membrane protein TolC